MQRDTTPAFQPFLGEDDGRYCVKLKRAPGEYHILSKPTSLSAFAKQDLKRIRREMWELWDARQQGRQSKAAAEGRASLLAALRAILPLAESRAEDMIDSAEETRKSGTPEQAAEEQGWADEAVAAVDAAKALLASLDAEG